MKVFPILLLVVLSLKTTAQKSDIQTTKDRKKVEEAASNYLRSIYEVDATLLTSISPNLVKQGYYYSRKDSAWSVSPMSYDELKHTAETYNQRGWIPPTAPKEVEILDMDERVANVKVYAIWGFDYLLLMKNDQDEWIIHQILWQSYNQKDYNEMVRKIRNGN